jgi:hypothetical protein
MVDDKKYLKSEKMEKVNMILTVPFQIQREEFGDLLNHTIEYKIRFTLALKEKQNEILLNGDISERIETEIWT